MDLKDANHSDIIKLIRKRQRKLKWTRKELKKHFVGLDSIIDTIIKNIEAWYVMPELLTRPVIICLWGPTGVGKTDLVRRLVKLLSFHDRFCEIDLMNKGGSNAWHTSISSVLSSNPNITSGKSSIILLDEIQNFRTIDENGHELSDYKYRDVWTLLSDGKLPFDVDVDHLIQLLWQYGDKSKRPPKSKLQHQPTPSPVSITRYATDSPYPETEPPEIDTDTIEAEDYDDDIGDDVYIAVDEELGSPSISPKDECEGDDETSYYSLKHFKTVLRLEDSLEEIATWSNSKKRTVIKQKLNDEKLYEQVDYTKSLIFVSGNLDEAYKFTEKTEEVDIDADIFHELSLKISILDIKSALTTRFKPEQIARFGNMQVVYPSLSKSSYKEIIIRKITEISNNVKNKFGINLRVTSNIHELIYQNGVFPTQGTRPVFSTISEIIESPMPIFLLQSFIDNVKGFKLDYHGKKVVAKIKNKLVKFPYEGVVDKLKTDRNKNMNRRVLSAVHEAGHAVVYAIMFKVAPPQLTALPAAQELGGFVYLHDTCGAKYLLEQKIAITLGGGEAEKIVFGSDNYTSGAKDDLHEATKLSGLMIKRYGMDAFSSFMMAATDRTDIYRTDIEEANKHIEIMIKKCLDLAQNAIRKNLPLFKSTIDSLLTHDNVTPDDFRKICSKHGLKIDTKQSKEVICSNYLDQYQAFQKNISK